MRPEHLQKICFFVEILSNLLITPRLGTYTIIVTPLYAVSHSSQMVILSKSMLSYFAIHRSKLLLFLYLKDLNLIVGINFSGKKMKKLHISS